MIETRRLLFRPWADSDAELGYWIAKPYWNQGLCTEALQAMIDWCSQLYLGDERPVKIMRLDYAL